MVELTPAIIFAMILLSVPLQFYLSNSSTQEANYYMYKIMTKMKQMYDHFVKIITVDIDIDEDGEVEKDISEQINEIIDDKVDKDSEGLESSTSGYFGGSQDVRDPRPPHVKYYVGQVIRHKIHGYRAVIISWDETARAPDWWLRRVHRDHKEWKDLPNYTVIIDTRDRLIPQIAYVVEENIVSSSGVVIHPLIKHYFEGQEADKSRYRIRPWHQKIFPYG